MYLVKLNVLTELKKINYVVRTAIIYMNYLPTEKYVKNLYSLRF